MKMEQPFAISEEVCLHVRQEQLLCASASVAAFLPVSFSALVDRRAPHRQSNRVLLAVAVLSLDQRLISQPLASHAVNEAIKPRQGMVLHVAFVQTERKFINVAAKMFFARMMIDAVDTALHYGENAFNAVCGHVVTDVFALVSCSNDRPRTPT
jgi:hypothetical protein